MCTTRGETFTNASVQCCLLPHSPFSHFFNTLRPRHNGRHFTDDMLKCISLNENFWILNKISPKQVPWCVMDNMAALVQIMAWRRTGDKSWSEAMLVCCTYWRIHMSLCPNDLMIMSFHHGNPFSIRSTKKSYIFTQSGKEWILNHILHSCLAVRDNLLLRHCFMCISNILHAKSAYLDQPFKLPVLNISGAWNWSSLCLQMAWYLMLPGHKQTQCWLQSWKCFLGTFLVISTWWRHSIWPTRTRQLTVLRVLTKENILAAADLN